MPLPLDTFIKNVEYFEETLNCVVCKNLLNDPVIVTKCGGVRCSEDLEDSVPDEKGCYSICRKCFGNSIKCSGCSKPLNKKSLLEDDFLKVVLERLKELKEAIRNVLEKNDLKMDENLDVNADIENRNPEEVAETVFKAPADITEEAEIINPTIPYPTSSTPKIGRKSKVLQKTTSGHSLGERSNYESPGDNIRRSSRKKSDSWKSCRGIGCCSRRKSDSSESCGENKRRSGSRKSDSSESPRDNVCHGKRRRSDSSVKSPEDNNKSKTEPSPNTSVLSSTNLNKKNYKGETLLHRAVIKGDIEKVRNLIAAGASVNTQDNNGWTPLHEACNHGFVEIAKLLLDNEALINVPSLKDNITPIHDALINDKIQIAILLASRGADMHAKTCLGLTALDLCKNEDDKAALIEACSPFTDESVPQPNKKVDTVENTKVTLLYSSLSNEQKEQLQKFAQMINADIVENFSPEVTHVITSCDNNGNCTRTMKILLGILTGKWIMNFQWIEVSLEYNHKVEEEVFEVQGTKHQPNSQGPKQSRKNMEQKFPPLFDGFNFYLYGQFRKPIPGKEDLLNLINT